MNTRAKLYTLCDITRTGARRTQDVFKYHQQQNYQTVLNTIGLRINPYIEKDPYQLQKSDVDVQFGKTYKDWTHCWVLEFEISYGIDQHTLEDDLNFIPFINNLNESVNFEKPIFDTKTELKNILIVFDK